MFYTFVIPISRPSDEAWTVSEMHTMLEKGNYTWIPNTFCTEKEAENATRNYLKYYVNSDKITPLIIYYTPGDSALQFEINQARTLGNMARCYFLPPIKVTLLSPVRNALPPSLSVENSLINPITYHNTDTCKYYLMTPLQTPVAFHSTLPATAIPISAFTVCSNSFACTPVPYTSSLFFSSGSQNCANGEDTLPVIQPHNSRHNR